MARPKTNKKPKESEEWLTQQDFENDLWAYSEFADPVDNYDPAPPKTILEWRNRKGQNNTESIFDREIPEDNVEYYISGRGRSIPHRTVRPGEPIKTYAHEEEEIVRKIREISGLGYRNEVIEQHLGQHAEFSDASEPSSSSANMCDLSLTAKVDSSSSIPSSDSCTVQRHTPQNTSRTSPASSTHSSGKHHQHRKKKSPSKHNRTHIDISSPEDFPPLDRAITSPRRTQ